ncbi:Chaperone protein dnaJ 11 [Hibiscus syriacus]|uniref:Chaperone protein dnaJ 11 n=1 Tax=Hibiscus syriacus TaxID=106335 RepID=A0A6A2X264_HIBSY|nr:chaperone protein dnaJ 11, chloroplastic-like [Hibiscus syriacus]KAE8668902.1 Chaperone protein dnaJ 11 [Hibiscus syriacus]
MHSYFSVSNSLTGYSISHPSTPRVRLRPTIAAISDTATVTATFNSKQQKASTPSGYLSRPGMAACTSLYEVLGISVGASSEEIKAAYRQLARICHPDVAAIGRKDSSADEFMKIHAAYSTLSDPEKRAVYDSKLTWRSQRPLTSDSRFSGYSGRSWETDQCW